MRRLLHLLGHDFRLLQRYQVITISVVVSAIYIGLFQLLQDVAGVEKILVLIIFNDPALLGFLFIGVLVLFERNEGTLAALSVVPLRIDEYLWSKALSLSAVAVGCCYAMVLVAQPDVFRPFQFGLASLLTSLIFSFLGFGVVASQTHFNGYLLRAIGVIIPLSLPFLGYFGVLPRSWFVLFPTYPAIELFDAAFVPKLDIGRVVLNYGLALLWAGGTYVWARRAMLKNFGL